MFFFPTNLKILHNMRENTAYRLHKAAGTPVGQGYGVSACDRRNREGHGSLRPLHAPPVVAITVAVPRAAVHRWHAAVEFLVRSAALQPQRWNRLVARPSPTTATGTRRGCGTQTCEKRRRMTPSQQGT